MAEHPILFKPEMARAIRDGRKTQTRRVCKKQPHAIREIGGQWDHGFWQCNDEEFDHTDRQWKPCEPYWSWWVRHRDGRFYEQHKLGKCPYGQPGDVLWVKEAWRLFDPYSIDYRASPTLDGSTFKGLRYLVGKPAGIDELIARDETNGRDPMRWRAAMYMPRWACRLRLEVVSVRVERVQDLDNTDILCEGTTPLDIDGNDDPWQNFEDRYQGAFVKLWDSINAKKGYGWDENPWVWVIEFKRREQDNT